MSPVATRVVLAVACLAAVACCVGGVHVVGSVDVDEMTFDPVVAAWHAQGDEYTVLVKFDKQYAYGESEEEFKAFAQMARHADTLLIVVVGISEIDTGQNLVLRDRFEIDEYKYPHYKVFRSDGTIYSHKSRSRRAEDLVRLVRAQGGVYIGLEGCLEDWDERAAVFMASQDRDPLLLDAADAIGEMEEGSVDRSTAEIYRVIMAKVVERGDDFVKTEYKRVKKLLREDMSDAKRAKLELRRNVLSSFRLRPPSPPPPPVSHMASPPPGVFGGGPKAEL